MSVCFKTPSFPKTMIFVYISLFSSLQIYNNIQYNLFAAVNLLRCQKNSTHHQQTYEQLIRRCHWIQNTFITFYMQKENKVIY
jgi:hypothetical protein